MIGDLLAKEDWSLQDRHTIRLEMNKLQQQVAVLSGWIGAGGAINATADEIVVGPTTLDRAGITMDDKDGGGHRPEIVFRAGAATEYGRLGGYSIASDKANAYILCNAYFDGTNWNIDDTARNGTIFQGSSGTADTAVAFQFRSVPLGTNPRTPNEIFRIKHGGLIGLRDSSETIASGVITVESSYVAVDTENGDASDDLDTISGGGAGDILILRAADDTHTVVLKDDADNLCLEGDFSMDTNQDRIMLIATATNWYEIARSNNG